MTTITVLIPAHNEESQLAATLQSLVAQDTPATRVLVVADNCTDSTVAVAQSNGADTFETVNNTYKKAGALNQALEQVLPNQGADDYILVMDADTQLAPEFLTVALNRLQSSSRLGAVGGVFYGDKGGRLLGLFQRNEYARYSREIDRSGRVMVLTGTAALFRPAALIEVAFNRGTTLPGTRGQVYDTYALTEDNELTLCLKTLGWALESPVACAVVTEIMPTWGDLWQQRLRWQRGALENLRTFGFTKVTTRYWTQQFMMGIGVFALYLYLTLTVISYSLGGHYTFNPFWLGITLIFMAERVVTAWKMGWKSRILALALVPEMAYDMFLQAVFLRALFDLTTKRAANWHHVTTPKMKGI